MRDRVAWVTPVAQAASPLIRPALTRGPPSPASGRRSAPAHGELPLEIWFYHLQSQPLERALPALLEKALERNWRVAVQTVDDLRVKAIDDLLWTYSADSFLPHATATDKAAAQQPIVVTRDGGNANDAALRIFLEGAEIELAADATYERVILIFDGGNDVELEAARRQWSRLKASGADLAYWRQNDEGRWERQT